MQKTKGFLEIMNKSYAPFRKTAVIMFLLLVAGQLIFLSFPYLQGKIIDNLAVKAPFQDSLVIGFIMIGLYLMHSLFNYAREKYEIDNFDFDLLKFIEKNSLKKILEFSLGQHINEHSGLRISVLQKGSSALKQASNILIYNVLPMFLQIFLVVIAISFINIWLGVIVVLIGSIYFYSLYKFNTRFYPRLKKNRNLDNKLNKFQSEILRNTKLIKASAKEEGVVHDYSNQFDEYAVNSKAIYTDMTKQSYARFTLLNISQVFAIMVGVYMVQAGLNSPGQVVMLIGWMASIFGNIGNIGWFQRQLITNFSDIGKYQEMMMTESAVKEPDNPLTPKDTKGAIELKGVSFKYPFIESIGDDDDDEEEDAHSEEDQEVSSEVLKDVSFKIEPGETVAIVGHSGSGKTTIVNLLLRGYDPDSGQILIDGVDLKDLDLKTIGYVPQHVELFDNTLKYNMAFAAEDGSSITDAELDEVAKKARIDQFYERLGSKRFETLIGENGVKLSGGERQRVGIARVLLQKPKILIFDEATSSLDAENEALIHEAMRDALKGRTGIIIAHRLSTIRDAHKIVVVDQGRVVGIGNHSELMHDCEVYKNLIKRQMMV